jgi:predicted RNase H-like HicB family nuclease
MVAAARKTEYAIPARDGFMAPIPVYRVVIHPAHDVGGYWAACDMDKGGCTVQGETIQETQAMMLESVAFYLEDYPEIKNYRLEFEYCDA